MSTESMPDVNLDCRKSLQLVKDKEVIVEIIQAVIKGLAKIGVKPGGLNLHFFENTDHHMLSYIHFYGLNFNE